jgi:hypothetical protein
MASTILTTKSGDLAVIPEIFIPYMVNRTTELSAFFQSGVVQTVPGLSIPASGGDLVTMPFWNDLAGDDQILDTSTDLDVAKVDSGKDQAVLHGRALVYGATDLAAALAGDDPMRYLGDLYAGKWSRVMQKLLISTLAGALPNATGNVLDISALSGAAAVFDASAFIDANQKLGDHKDRIAAVAMHSATEALISKEDLIETVRDSQGNILYRTYMGKRLIIDDSMPVADGVYTTYLFGEGAIGYGEGSPKVPLETERQALANGGQEYLVSRRHFVLHPRGIRWTPASGVPAKDTPSNSEIAGTGNWTRVWDAKQIRIVQFKHRLAAA